MIGLREAISNILLHRDLSKYKERVYSKIVVFKDRIEFINVGNLYGSNTIEKIKIPSTNVEARNETMVKLVETLGGVIENRHTGIKTMIDEMKKANLPEPIFKNEREDFSVTFFNGEYPEYYPEELQKEKNVTINVTKNVTTNVTIKLEKIESKIIELLKNNSKMTQEELAKEIGVVPMTIKRNMNKLKEKGIIERVGSSKKGYWRVNY